MPDRDRWRVRGKLREYAESPKGKEFYGLHDNGVKFAETQAEMTPLQRFVYTLAKDYHEEDHQEPNPSGMKKAHGATRGF